jgi:hypothetical protein
MATYQPGMIDSLDVYERTRLGLIQYVELSIHSANNVDSVPSVNTEFE